MGLADWVLQKQALRWDRKSKMFIRNKRWWTERVKAGLGRGRSRATAQPPESLGWRGRRPKWMLPKNGPYWAETVRTLYHPLTQTLESGCPGEGVASVQGGSIQLGRLKRYQLELTGNYTSHCGQWALPCWRIWDVYLCVHPVGHSD